MRFPIGRNVCAFIASLVAVISCTYLPRRSVSRRRVAFREDGMRIQRQLLATMLVGVCAAWFTAGVAHAQSFQGGMRGSVKDAQGVIPGVTITLINEANGVNRDTVSNASGEYSFP